MALVLCAIALSLAYPVREYIAERRQIDQLQVQSQQIALEIRKLQAEHKHLLTPAFIEQQARDRLHMTLPGQIVYEIVGGGGHHAGTGHQAGVPWYARLWSSVQQADHPLPAPKHARHGQPGPGKALHG